MSKLLINEPPLMVLPSLAVAIGLNEAIALQQLHYWLQTTPHHHDGRAWIYNSAAGWQENFPFWSESIIRRVFASLRERGLIVVGNYNKLAIDRTLWYSIDYDELSNLDTPFVKNITPSFKNEVSSSIFEGPIPETTTKTTTERETPPQTTVGPSLTSEETTKTPTPVPFHPSPAVTAGELTQRRAKSLKYCREYNWQIHRPTFEAIVDAMGKRALVDADNDRTIGELQQAAVTLTKAGVSAETIIKRTGEWKASWIGQRNGSASQFIEFMGTASAVTASGQKGSMSRKIQVLA